MKKEIALPRQVEIEPLRGFNFLSHVKSFEVRGFTLARLEAMPSLSIGDPDMWDCRYEWKVREASSTQFVCVWNYKMSHPGRCCSAWGDQRLLIDLFGTDRLIGDDDFGYDPSNHLYDSAADLRVVEVKRILNGLLAGN
jgi:hypothetical protein